MSNDDERRVAEYIFNGYTGSLSCIVPTPWIHIDPAKWGLSFNYPCRHIYKNEGVDIVRYSYFTPGRRCIASHHIMQPKLTLREMCFLLLLSANNTIDYR